MANPSSDLHSDHFQACDQIDPSNLIHSHIDLLRQEHPDTQQIHFSPTSVAAASIDSSILGTLGDYGPTWRGMLFLRAEVFHTADCEVGVQRSSESSKQEATV